MNQASIDAANAICREDQYEESGLGRGDAARLSKTIDKYVEPTEAKLKTAMELLSIAAREMEGQPIMGTDYWRRYYALTGQHMILTEEGWKSGESKQAYIEQAYANQCPISDVILDEVNAP